MTNTGQWVFDGVDGRYTIAFVVAARIPGTTDLAMCGPFQSRQEFDRGRSDLALVPAEEFLTWTRSAMFPLLPDQRSVSVFRRMRRSPEFGNGSFRPMIELRPVEDRSRIGTDLANPIGPIPILTGASFNQWNPDFGPPYGFAAPTLLDHLLDKSRRSARMQRSPIQGISFESHSDLPIARARVAFRDLARATDSRTVIASLIPPMTAVMHAAPFLVRRGANEADEAFALGVLSSIPFDWYARRIVELHLTFDLLNSMPVPAPAPDDQRRVRVTEIAARLAAVDERYADWASSVGVPVGSVTTESEKGELVAELDAVVAHLYGLDRDDVVHVFETFHRGWDYRQRLKRVLGYFDEWSAATSAVSNGGGR